MFTMYTAKRSRYMCYEIGTYLITSNKIRRNFNFQYKVYRHAFSKILRDVLNIIKYSNIDRYTIP